MKSILLHGPAQDATDKFCDAGRELVVDESGDEGTIDPQRATELVESLRAVDAAAEPADEFGDATVADLRQIAEAEQIDLGGATRKDDIKAAIRAHRAVQAPVDLNMIPPEPPVES